MAKSKSQKNEIIKNLSQKLSEAKSIVFTNFNAFGVKENEEIRNKLRENGGEYIAVKKTLLKLALKKASINIEVPDKDGQLAVVLGYQDEVSPAKIINDFIKIKENEGKLSFVGGILEGKFIEEHAIKNLANLPSKKELYAKLLGSINAPISGLVNVLAGNLRSFVRVLSLIAEKK